MVGFYFLSDLDFLICLGQKSCRLWVFSISKPCQNGRERIHISQLSSPLQTWDHLFHYTFLQFSHTELLQKQELQLHNNALIGVSQHSQISKGHHSPNMYIALSGILLHWTLLCCFILFHTFNYNFLVLTLEFVINSQQLIQMLAFIVTPKCSIFISIINITHQFIPLQHVPLEYYLGNIRDPILDYNST